MNGRRGGSESRRHPRSSAVSPPSKQKNSGASGKPRASLLGGHRTRGGDDASAFTPRPSAPIESAIADPYLPEIICSEGGASVTWLFLFGALAFLALTLNLWRHW